MKIYITADFHYSHENIIRYCSRPFPNIGSMNDALIHNANSIVRPEDMVYHIGDFSFSKPWSNVVSRLNGTWIFLWGNHDFKRLNGVPLHRAIELRRRGKRIYMNHHPEECVGISGYDLYLTAHSHEKWKVKVLEDKKLINVGVDVWNFTPVSLDKLIGDYCA
jgi:calcineurin-like phosphoesterase family protein